MPEENSRDPEHNDGTPSGLPSGNPDERVLVHRILRYVPNLVRDEWVNIGVLLYDPNTGERGLRLIEDTTEFNRVRRLHPRFDETALRGLRDHLESRFGAAMQSNGNGGPIRNTLRNGEGNPRHDSTEWLSILEKWDATLSQSLQLADPKATTADDLNAEIDRLYDERVSVVPLTRTRVQPGAPRTRPQMRYYMDQVFRQASLWSRIEKFVPASRFTLDDDPLLIDYSYVRTDNRMRGFIQTISLTEKPEDVRIFTPVAQKIQEMASRSKPGFSPEFTAVTDTDFNREKAEQKFFDRMLGNTGVTPIPLDNFAVWVAKLRPLLLQ